MFKNTSVKKLLLILTLTVATASVKAMNFAPDMSQDSYSRTDSVTWNKPASNSNFQVGVGLGIGSGSVRGILKTDNDVTYDVRVTKSVGIKPEFSGNATKQTSSCSLI